MSGRIKQIINQILDKKSNGSDLIKLTLKTKFVLKGIDPDKYSEVSSDDPAVLEKLKSVAQDFDVEVDFN